MFLYLVERGIRFCRSFQTVKIMKVSSINLMLCDIFYKCLETDMYVYHTDINSRTHALKSRQLSPILNEI